ncbi:MAG: hypothetical protein WCL18_05240 [bacterium]
METYERSENRAEAMELYDELGNQGKAVEMMKNYNNPEKRAQQMGRRYKKLEQWDDAIEIYKK